MPRYFFDVHDGKVVRDEVGVDLADLDAVREEARRVTFDMASTVALSRDAVQLHVNVRDRAGHRIFTGTLLFLIETPG